MDTPRLITDYANYDMGTMTDLLMILMRDIEDAMMQTGATPGVDYSRRDLMTWALAMYPDKNQKGKRK